MTLKSRLSSLLIAPPSHREPLSRLDRLDGRTEPPVEDFAGESRAEVQQPKGARR